jgi:2-octaprenyl-6-methoxyphenol hydroxylase
MTDHYDIAIVGGGPVGAALVLALADSDLSVVVLEARTEPASRDPRAIALSRGSRLILDRLGAWTGLEALSTAITRIHVSQRGAPGETLITAAEAGVPALGYTVEYGDLHAALAGGLADSGAQLIRGARVTGVRPAAGCGLVEYESTARDTAPPAARLTPDASPLTARLIVLADGGRGLPAEQQQVKDYGSDAVVCAVRTEKPHLHLAYERFTPQGPMALLPLGETYALVWTGPRATMAQVLELPEADFLARLHDAFGNRQGLFLSAGPRGLFPLRLITARVAERPGLVRIGNAAQTLHPVAGQGFNLGLRDAWHLAQTVLDSRREDLGGQDFLDRYRASRRWDVGGGVAMTDLLVSSFLGDALLPRALRGAALTLLDALPPLKAAFARKMMFGAQAW